MLTINSSAGDAEIRELGFTGKTLTIKGGAKNALSLGNCAKINSLTGFAAITINGKTEIEKTLTAADLTLGKTADITIGSGATLTVNKMLRGENGAKITLIDGFKPIVLKGKKAEDSISDSPIKLVSTADLTGKQIFTATFDLYGKFDLSGIAPDASYDLALQKGKVYLMPFILEMDGQKYAYWDDVISKMIDKTVDYTISLLADHDIGAAMKLPTKGKYSSITIDGKGHKLTFVGTSVSLSGTTTFKDVTVSALDRKGSPVKWTINT